MVAALVVWTAAGAWRFRPLAGPRPAAPGSAHTPTAPRTHAARVGASAGRRRGVGRRRGRRPPAAAPLRLAAVVDLLAVALVGGQSLHGALGLVVRHAPPGELTGLDEVVAAMDRGGGLADALDAWVARLGPPAEEVRAVLTDAERDGAAVHAALVSLSADLRRRHRRTAETAARRLPVRMLLPLVGCVLPAFILVAVVPSVAVGLQGLMPGP